MINKNKYTFISETILKFQKQPKQNISTLFFHTVFTVL